MSVQREGAYMLTLTSTYMQPSNEPTKVIWWTCLRCGGSVVELGPNTEVRTLHDLWHIMQPGLTVPEASR